MLVHCFGGRSRSAAFVAAYLMSSRSWGFDQAMAVICAVRPVASVNRGFERQLRAYAQTGYDVYAAQQVLLRNRIRALHEIRGSWRSPSTQSFRKHRSSGKVTSISRNGGSEFDQNRRTDSSSSSSNGGFRNEYDAKGSYGVGLGCDSFTSSGKPPPLPLSPLIHPSIFLSLLSVYRPSKPQFDRLTVIIALPSSHSPFHPQSLLRLTLPLPSLLIRHGYR